MCDNVPLPPDVIGPVFLPRLSADAVERIVKKSVAAQKFAAENRKRAIVFKPPRFLNRMKYKQL